MESKTIVLKSAEIADGYKVELVSENNGATFRLNASIDGGYHKTRVFTSYEEASNLFNSYLQGN